MMMGELEIQAKQSRTELLLLILVFAAPILGAWLIYYHTDIGKGPGGNHGNLINPPIAIPDFQLQDGVTGNEAGKLHQKWSLMYVMPEDCGQQCQNNLLMMQNLKSSLTKNASRIQLVLVVNNESMPSVSSDTQPQIEPVNFRLLSGDVINEHLRKLDNSSVPALNLLLLIDPAGNLMMRYNESSNGAGILQDIKRLLRYSRIG